jgi:hypothetical protein
MFFVVLSLMAVSGPASAQVWNEQGDAGDLPGTAQVPVGAGALSFISGVISDKGDADMYCIHIDGNNFGASLCDAAFFDTQLFVFTPAGIGVSHRDDFCELQSTLGEIQPGPGNVLLAISGYDKDPVNAAGSEIWEDGPFGDERVPDGPGAPGPVAGWIGFGDNGEYRIALTGVSYCADATPVRSTTWGNIKATYRN